MSLDTLFHQVLLSEQQLTKQTQQYKEVKAAIFSYTDRIRSAAEESEAAAAELDEKAQQLSAMRLQHDLMKKCEAQMLKQKEDMLCQQSLFRERLAKIKRESEDEEENFLQEISRFNSDFSLRGNRETVFESQTHTEILELEREVESLYKEMELMSHSSSHVSCLQTEKKAMQAELRDLDNTLKGLDRQVSEAEATTESLKAEILVVGQKPLTDSNCLRLRNELEMYKEDELELLREALASDIHFLQSKLHGSQGSEQHWV